MPLPGRLAAAKRSLAARTRSEPPSCGYRGVRSGPPGRAFEISPALGRCGACVVGRVVVVELALSLLGDHAKDAQV
jgi:hypothetical protein